MFSSNNRSSIVSPPKLQDSNCFFVGLIKNVDYLRWSPTTLNSLVAAVDVALSETSVLLFNARKALLCLKVARAEQSVAFGCCVSLDGSMGGGRGLFLFL